jgi:hypothetical protein
MTSDTHQDDMPDEIDFSAGTRGKFFKPNATLNLPVCLEASIQTYLAQRAHARGINMTQLVNEILQKDNELIETVR